MKRRDANVRLVHEGGRLDVFLSIPENRLNGPWPYDYIDAGAGEIRPFVDSGQKDALGRAIWVESDGPVDVRWLRHGEWVRNSGPGDVVQPLRRGDWLRFDGIWRVRYIDAERAPTRYLVEQEPACTGACVND